MAFSSSLLTAEWLNTPTNAASVDGTVYPQRPHRDGVEAVGVALEDVDVQTFTCVNDVAALVHGEREDILRLHVFSHQLPEKLRRELRVQNDGRVSTLKKACQQFGRTGESRARYVALANHLEKHTRATRVMKTRWTRNCSNHSILQIYMACQPGKTTAREALLVFTCFLL